ncbi:MAG: PAS domain-containing sensor histidine kinase [Pseudomonadota bacterium]
MLQKINRLRALRRVQSAVTIGLVVLGPILAVLTYMILGSQGFDSSSPALRGIILVNLVYVLLLAALVAQRIVQMVAARRAKSAGSRLHLRLTGVFALVALLPAVFVAVFAGLTINLGIESWFSDRVQRVIAASRTAAEAYEAEHRNNLARDAVILASYMNTAREESVFVADTALRQVLSSGQANIQNDLKEAFVIDGQGEIQARGQRSYLFDFEMPTQAEFEEARAQGLTVIKDWPQNEFRALMPLEAYPDRYLYISRSVDGQILTLLDETQETAAEYQRIESDRGRVLFEYALLYLGFAVVLILAAVFLGLWFAERLSRPIGRLAGAAQRVGMGDLSVVVKEDKGDDEIAMLGRYFNQMTRQLKGQRDTLMDNTQQIEERRRLFDSVLSSVTSGVIGVDARGAITFANRSAKDLLTLTGAEGEPLDAAIPEFSHLFDRLVAAPDRTVQGEVTVAREGGAETLLVRMAPRKEGDALEGYVLAFDDVTDLVAAQRSAAWGDVARRIAHEIKNPLTPIQLSAERIKRKFRTEISEPEDLEQMTDVIVRQTNDLRRIVDEFSKFARMPEPQRRPEDVVGLVRDAVLLQRGGVIPVKAELPKPPVYANIDATMVTQAMTNLIKNACEATETRREKFPEHVFEPQVTVELKAIGDMVELTVADNGVGLPKDRAKLFEPYVTTRDKGTGLGLPIVKKIIEEHGGTLVLSDAPAGPDGHKGAIARVMLPGLVQLKDGDGGQKTA